MIWIRKTRGYSVLSKEALSHRTYVEGVLRHYHENDIVPEDPNEGIWHLAHYPLPKRLGGTQVICLLREHHAVQGVLQSEEYECMCFAMWERTYLPPELLPLYDKWKSWQSAENLKAWYASMTPEEKAAHIARWHSGHTPEFHARRVAKSGETQKRRRGKPCILESESGETRSYRSRREAAMDLGLVGSHLRRTLTPHVDGTPRFTKGWRLLP